jgi:hypothetical protein
MTPERCEEPESLRGGAGVMTVSGQWPPLAACIFIPIGTLALVGSSAIVSER